MKLLFIHDHPFYIELNNKVYSGGSFPKSIWENYFVNFEAITVYARKSKSIQSKNSLSSTYFVSFYLTDKYSSILKLIKNINLINRELKSLITEADVILVRLPSVLGFIAAEQAFKMNKKVWVEQVGNAKEALGSYGSLLGKIAAPLFDYQNKKIVSKAEFVTYVTEFKLQKDYPPNKSAISISLSDVIINKILAKNEIDNERFFGCSFRIGLIGGFDAKYKGQDLLLNAIALLDQNVKKNIKINFIGKGNSQWIVNLAENLNLQDNIEFIGPLEAGDQINAFLQSLSLYVQPSMTEGMPRATIEAMAMGCPVIGSNVGGIPDIVSDRFVHEKGNVNELSNHIKILFNDRNILEQESILSLEKAIPYLKTNLDKKRNKFYNEMNKILKK